MELPRIRDKYIMTYSLSGVKWIEIKETPYYVSITSIHFNLMRD